MDLLGRRSKLKPPVACEDASGGRAGIPGLLVKDSLTITTPSGECKIELCLGDITKLDPAEKVDVLLLSAYGGSYSKSVGLMGSLYRNNGIDIAALAKDREEDLRELYSCWWSRPLAEDLPYKRILCFETRGSSFSGSSFYDMRRQARGRPHELVSHAFRCLVPILNNQDGTVITPLLNTGQQGCDECEMLEGMVMNAVNWMKAGLPLRLLKIVIYAKVLSPTQASMILQRGDGSEILTVFSQLREKLETKSFIPKTVKLDYDVYLSHSSKDQAVVDSIHSTLSALKPDLRIYASHQQLDNDAIWQDDIYDVMTKSARVITVLSPNYLASPDCMEQYNIALCCNRQAYRDILAPFFVETVALPTYMGLVQYADCRENQAEKIRETCQNLIKSLPSKTQEDEDGSPAEENQPRYSYDIFISYSHRDSETANLIKDTLKELDSSLRIFYDIQELKQGHSWQQTLYHSIDESRSMIAVLSNNYLQSAVCQEEYSLAQTKHLTQDNLKLLPLRIEELDQDVSFSEVTLVTATPDVFESTAQRVCKGLVDWLSNKKQTGESDVDEVSRLFAETVVSERLNVGELMEDHRKKMFKHNYNSSSLLLKDKFPPKCFSDQDQTQEARSDSEISYRDLTGEVILSFHPNDEKFATALKCILGRAAPGLVVKTDAAGDKERMNQLENARHVVAFLSPHYVESPKHVEEFHIALWRQRVSPLEAPLLIPVKVLALPKKPSYFQLVGSVVDLWDPLWPSLDLNIPLGTGLNWMRSLPVSRGEALALLELARITLATVETANNLPKQEGVIVRPALVNPVHIKAEVKAITDATRRHSSKGGKEGGDGLESCCCIVCRRTNQLLKKSSHSK